MKKTWVLMVDSRHNTVRQHDTLLAIALTTKEKLLLSLCDLRAVWIGRSLFFFVVRVIEKEFLIEKIACERKILAR